MRFCRAALHTTDAVLVCSVLFCLICSTSLSFWDLCLGESDTDTLNMCQQCVTLFLLPTRCYSFVLLERTVGFQSVTFPVSYVATVYRLGNRDKQTR